MNFPTITPNTTLPVSPAPLQHTFTDMLQNWLPMDSVSSMLKEVLTKLEMVLDQQTTILRLLQQREVQVQPLAIEEGSARPYPTAQSGAKDAARPGLQANIGKLVGDYLWGGCA